MFELWDRSCLSFRLQREPGILPRAAAARPQVKHRGPPAPARTSLPALPAAPGSPALSHPHPVAGGIGCVLLGYEDSCSLESSGSSGIRDTEPSDPAPPQPALGEQGAGGGMLLDLAVKCPMVRSKIKVTARTPTISSLAMR